eukprot:TRINITY_DN23338_c0_g1_i1.p1 TRINITY_DN23338_c0_g1~~TRINITY_DN23338_c0_g1_i1.p1  ORF type:complete len:212 (+),score=40.01 TRINITY_DN23338_c0_g1_i1:196-831(+)
MATTSPASFLSIPTSVVVKHSYLPCQSFTSQPFGQIATTRKAVLPRQSKSLPYAVLTPSARRLSTSLAASALEVAEEVEEKPPSEAELASPAGEEEDDETVVPAITLSEKALKHLTRMRSDLSSEMLLRIGVRQGGCSGYSYVMDFEERANIRGDDSIIEYEGFAMVCDPKSLLFLYGMQLDYNDALIGGGFSFTNPNASATCGCGKSFAA